jgi:N-acetylmuramoyl-L-alanine amidase
VTRSRPTILKAATTTLILSITLHAQTPTPPQPTTNRNLIFLDPAHGGPDTGAQFPNHILEKDLTLAFTARLRTTLAAASFNIMAPRDADPAEVLLPDQRASLANHARPTACLLIHATPSGSGVHIFTSTLPDIGEVKPWQPVPWDTAQSSFISPSRQLADLIAASLLQAKIPVILSPASIAPLDNLTCPALALEIAPLTIGDATTPVTDAAYQQRIAAAITAAIQQWRTLNPPAHSAAPPTGVNP